MPSLLVLPFVAAVACLCFFGTARFASGNMPLRKVMRVDPRVAFIVDTRGLKASGLIEVHDKAEG